MGLCADPCFRVYRMKLRFLRLSSTLLGKRNANAKCKYCNYSITSRVPTVLLLGHSTELYISCQSLCLIVYHKPGHSICIIGAILISCLVSELKKLSSLGLEPMAAFRDCGLCSCNLPTKTNNLGLFLYLSRTLCPT